ncbi:MAG TPA: trypsin-like serine protease [Oligoflexus sp.]|uniref:S1 family peptidase n=1 Tax=Oligoflexus sp. TaxID=1971216 RepID=UPI002D69AC8C|nr:trypsin-like serine protease [Oligoflexus sp.]HYX37463.1 trypsin-like serine protease [Oligoflexus sp.]
MQRHQARRGGLCLSIMILVLAPSCKHLGEDSSEKIVNGERVDPEDPIASHTVSIMDPDPDVGQYCTAVVLARDVLLTAAHCFNDKSRRAYALFSTAYNPKLGMKQQPLIKIRRIAVHAQYTQDKGDAYDKKIVNAERPDQLLSPGRPLYDIALAYLDSRIPDAYQPAPLAGSGVDFINGQITTAGYGCTTTICRGKTNILRKIPLRYVRTFPEASMVVLSAGSRHGSCSGDSGGPDFIDEGGILRVFALVSTGPDACEAGLSVDTLVEPYKGWIEQATSAVRSGRRGSSYTLTDF